jgi:hypothetical protein
MSNIQNITEQFKGLSAEELLTIIAAATAEAKKAVKTVSKAPKEAKEKKGSMPKGSVPPQLVKPRAWVNFTLDHANTFGWESFEVKGQAEPMPASVLVDGKPVFEATGKPMNNKQAMSLSKVRWDRKAGKGTREDLYKEFEASPALAAALAAPKEVSAAPKEVSAAPAESASAACSVSEVEVVLEAPKPKKAAAPKKTEEEKKAEKEAAALKKAQEKEAETLRKKEETLRKKEEAAAAKAAAKPVAAPKGKKVAEKEAVPAFDHENDGFAHPWDFKGKQFLRDYEGNMWLRTADGESGGWAGKFDPATNSIDTEAEEPELESDDETNAE